MTEEQYIDAVRDYFHRRMLTCNSLKMQGGGRNSETDTLHPQVVCRNVAVLAVLCEARNVTPRPTEHRGMQLLSQQRGASESREWIQRSLLPSRFTSVNKRRPSGDNHWPIR